MFSFLEDVENLTGLPFEILKDGFKMINYANKCIFIENYKNVVLLESDKVLLKIPKGIVNVEGKNLKLKQLNRSSLIVVGEVSLLKVE